jgi:hypothetical protein
VKYCTPSTTTCTSYSTVVVQYNTPSFSEQLCSTLCNYSEYGLRRNILVRNYCPVQVQYLFCCAGFKSPFDFNILQTVQWSPFTVVRTQYNNIILYCTRMQWLILRTLLGNAVSSSHNYSSTRVLVFFSSPASL